MNQRDPLPSSALAVLAQGQELHRQGRIREAIDAYLRALAISPDSVDAMLGIAAALHDWERYDEALTVYGHALGIDPHCAPLWHNMGNTLLAADRFPEAIESYQHAVSLDPGDIEAMVTMGTALEQMGKYRQARICYEEALRRNDQSAEAHWNLALSLLRYGDFGRGWGEFAWRWQKKGYTTTLRDFDAQPWNGESPVGRRILVHAEQAFGDAIQFVRFLPHVAKLGGEIFLEAPAPLVPLFATMPAVERVIPAGEPLPPADYHVPLMSLPRLLGITLDRLPGQIPYLYPLQDRVLRWQRLLEGRGQGGMKVGLVWAGRRRPDPHRSCQLSRLAPLAGIAGVTYCSLQVGEGGEQAVSPPEGLNLVDLAGEMTDFAETAACLAQLDLVISIDTAVAHLAGAMGKPVFLMLPFAADWRWMLDRDDSPWYPTMRLFRQPRHGAWDEVVEGVRQALETWCHRP